MPKTSARAPFSPNCAGRDVMNDVVSKWGMLVIIALSERPYRYAELRRRVGGASERMLSLTLRTLTEDGFVSRRDYGEVPPRVEYSLTPLGEDLSRPLAALGAWISTHTPEIVACRREARTASRGL